MEEFGKVEEYDEAKEENFDLFCMYSYYYFCEIEDGLGPQNLDDYESEYGFTPKWVPLKHAIAVNRVLF